MATLVCPLCGREQDADVSRLHEERDNWQIVDENGKVLREIDRVCADDHIAYP